MLNDFKLKSILQREDAPEGGYWGNRDAEKEIDTPSPSKVQIVKKGLVDDNIYGYEMTFGPSWLNFGRDFRTNTFILDMVGTSSQERNRGHATRLLDVFFRMVSQIKGVVKVDVYTAAGEIYLRHIIERLAQKHKVRLVK